ncbi:MAG: DUF397 domain-containing protein [Streptosporangiales bacterium]|nr:DUF397 domain-containing protein [Streptosporangiales bacterium]
MAVRDSKDPDGPTVAFHPRDWSAFLGAVKPATSTPQASGADV